MIYINMSDIVIDVDHPLTTNTCYMSTFMVGGKTTSNLQGSHRLQESIIRVCVCSSISLKIYQVLCMYIYIYINRYISISGICVSISIHTKI